jgi:predicted transcriptional regulator
VARKLRSTQFTPAELELMNILWEHGPSSVQAITERLPKNRKLAYTTVQTVLNVLHRKGKVIRVLKGRAYQYEAASSRTGTAKQALQDLIQRFFGGTPERLVLTMVETRQLTPEKLEELQRLIESGEITHKDEP